MALFHFYQVSEKSFGRPIKFGKGKAVAIVRLQRPDKRQDADLEQMLLLLVGHSLLSLRNIRSTWRFGEHLQQFVCDKW